MIRAFLAISTFLLIFAVLTNTQIPLIDKKVASYGQEPSSKPTSIQRLEGFGTPAQSNQSQTESVLMNDPAIHKMWGLEKANALDAWQLSQGSRDIIVAVVDTGIDVNHPDLKNNLWRNPGETGKDSQGRDKATNGIDDDNNGYIDDVHGWNFVHNNNHIKDNHDHGTHIAGIIGAEGGNNFGITGIAPKVSIMVLKYYDPNSDGDNLVNTIKAFEYAVQMNAHIINYSGGGKQFSQKEFEVVKKAEQKGILFVAAAGNEHSNSDINKYYPADYELDNIISVTAIDPDLKVLPTSNYGVRTVDIAAPGENIYSTKPDGKFGHMTGTSQATAFVSGVAALLMAHNRDFDAKSVRKYILNTGDELGWLKNKTRTSKKLNVYRALTMLDQGVGASGVVARNTANPEADFFAAPVGDNKRPASINSFGKKLLDALKEKDNSQ
jgi:thermitase